MKLLFVDCCISQRGSGSRTRALANAFLNAYRESHPETEIETVDLTAADLRPFNAERLNDRDALARAGKFDDPAFDLARQFREADRVVVAAPLWDLCFPAALRAYVEHISVVGLSYHYTESGVHGDCAAQHLAYLTSGGDFEREDSLGVALWRQLCGLFGIPRFDHVFAGGLDAVPDQASEFLNAACARAAELAKEF